MDSYIWGLILVGMLATFATRALPFIVLGQYAQHPLLKFLGRYLPPVMMVLLVVYATGSMANDVSTGVILGVSAMCVALLQWFFSNPLLSIFLGTLIYAVLI